MDRRAATGGGWAACSACAAGGRRETAQLRILLVTPDGRGRGLGRALVDRMRRVRPRGRLPRLVLWTNDPLAAARRIYLERGFRLVDEERHRSFGAELVGQNYVLAL